MTRADLVDLILRVKGLRDPAEAEAAYPAIRTGLEGIIAAVRLRCQSRRRSPELEASAEWFRRELAGSPLADGARGEAEGLIGELKRLVGAPHRRRRRPTARVEPSDNDPMYA
jgi:hypothetical protein